MKSFWNRTTVCFLFCVMIVLFISYYIYIKGFGIANSITLAVMFITMLSTLYSNHKSDERVNNQLEESKKQFEKQLKQNEENLNKQLKQNEENLNKQLKQNEENLNKQLFFNKRQEIYINLYNVLNIFWEKLDDKRVQFLRATDPTYTYDPFISYDDFYDINRIINTFYISLDFLYVSSEIQNIINIFLEYVNNNLKSIKLDFYLGDFKKRRDVKALNSSLARIRREEKQQRTLLSFSNLLMNPKELIRRETLEEYQKRREILKENKEDYVVNWYHREQEDILKELKEIEEEAGIIAEEELENENWRIIDKKDILRDLEKLDLSEEEWDNLVEEWDNLVEEWDNLVEEWDNLEEYHEAIEILSKIFPLLRQE